MRTFKVGDRVQYEGEGLGTVIDISVPGEVGIKWDGDPLTSREEVNDPVFWLAEDLVNHPPHYTKYPVEVIELTRHMSFGRGNAVKYIARAGLKSKETELEDLRKALFYIQDEITMLEDRA